jgi:hypothetical protein
MRKFGILIVFLLAVPTAALAQGNLLFWGIEIGSTDYHVEQTDKVTVTTLSGRLGWDVFPWLAIEARALTSGSASNNTGISDLKIAYMGSAYARFSLAASRSTRVKLYALGGYSVGQLQYTSSGVDTNFNTNGISYGGGVELYADDNNGINFEWCRLVDASSGGKNYTINQFALGYVHRF